MDHGQNFINDELHSLYSAGNIIWRLSQGGCGGRNMLHAWGRGDVFAWFWFGGPNVRDHREDIVVIESVTLRWTLGREGSMGRTGFFWLRIGSSGGFL
jgi:hypothetical protein